MHIRPTKKDDIDDLRDLLVETWHHTYDATIGAARVTEITGQWHSRDRLLNELGNADFVSLVAEDDDGRLLGHALVRLTGDDEACLSRLYVLPHAQGKGAGSGLLGQAIAHAQGRERMVLEVEESNLGARAFYERHGFVVSGRKANCGDQDGVPTLDMVRRLTAGPQAVRTDRR